MSLYNLENWKINMIIQKIKQKEVYLKPDINSNESNLSDLDVKSFDDEDEKLIQRELIWDKTKNQNLIKTIFNQKLVPALILNENKRRKDFKLSIIDGKQRLNTIWMFANNKFKFRDSKKNYFDNSDLESKTYGQLSETQKNIFDNFEIPIIIWKGKNKEELKYIFELLNTTSTPLRPQEIRHAIYHDDLTRFFNNFHKVCSIKNKNGEDSIIDEFLETRFFNKVSVLNRKLDEFILKILRLYIKEKILNDGKVELDKYYEENDFDSNKFNQEAEKKFFSLLSLTVEYYNFLSEKIPLGINKPIIIYILFYLAMQKLIDLKDFSVETENKFEYVFGDLNEDNSFLKSLRNQNQKTNRTNLIELFKTELENKLI